MTYGIIENRRCTNVIEADESFAKFIGAVPILDGYWIGDYFDGQSWYHPKSESEILESEKSARIAQSKADLETYLAEHPLQWTDGEYYSITAEKQNQLTSKIMAATMAQTLSADYILTWNSTGEVCKEWTLQDLSALAFAIDARVTKLVGYQQAQEVAMRNAETLDELNAIEVDYDAVS